MPRGDSSERAFPTGLRFRLVTLVIAALAPFIILIAFVARQHQANQREATETAARAAAIGIARKMDDRIATMQLALLALKHAIVADPARVAENDRILRRFNVETPKQFDHFAVIAADGTNIGTSDSLLNGARLPLQLPERSAPANAAEFRILEPHPLFGVSGVKGLALVYRLDDRGSRLVGFLSLPRIRDEVLQRDLSPGSVAALVDEDGRVLAAVPDADYWSQLAPRSTLFAPSDGASGIGLLGRAGGDSLYSAYARLEKAPYRIYVGTPTTIAFAIGRRDLLRAVGWGSLAFLLGLMLAWTQATRIIRPIRTLGEDAAILGKGNLSHRSTISSDDELGHLASIINSMAETLERREEGALQSQKMEAVGHLAGGIAHDFNNLLTVISGRIEFLASSNALGPDEREDVAEVQAATSRAVSLTKQLLAFSRKQILRPRVVDLNAVLDELEPMLRRLIGEDVQIVIKREARLGRVVADSGQIHQVILNLSLNARDAMPTGGMLTIETHNEHVGADTTILSRGDYVAISVTDSGRGMDDRTKARIFDPFFTTKPIGKGTGLGLSTVYGIVKQSGATITVETAQGKGSTFRVYFPTTTSAATDEFPVVTTNPGRGDETILIVEDERAVCEFAGKVLQALGYQVIAAESGEDALRIVASTDRQIDLLLTDVVMPGMSGPKLSEALIKLRPGIKVLYMSGYTDDEFVRRGVSDTTLELVQKPFTADQLVAKARAALDA